ncbi:MAG: hypothetical protein R2708_01120 [Vicinamibacterales bacterium]
MRSPWRPPIAQGRCAGARVVAMTATVAIVHHRPDLLRAARDYFQDACS